MTRKNDIVSVDEKRSDFTMKIACTAKARELLKSSSFIDLDADEPADFFSWHAHVYIFQRRKILLLINDLTGFPVVFYRPKVAQLKNFESLAVEAIREAFLDYGVKPEHVDRYFEMGGNVNLTGKTTRRVLSRLTEWKDITSFTLLRCSRSPFKELRLTQPAFARKVFPLTWTNYKMTTDLLTDAFQKHLSLKAEDVYSVESLKLHVQLIVGKHRFTRVLLVPANTTLDILHQVIQKAFGWGDHHLHQFLLLPEGAESIYEPRDIVIQNAEEPEDIEMWEETKPVLIDATLTVKEALELPYELWYEHDLGDSWAHKITLVDTLQLPNRVYRVLSAVGETPPDDVGGESGYEEFLAVMADENHIDHENYLGWYEMQTSHRMSVAQVNRWLEYGRFV